MDLRIVRATVDINLQDIEDRLEWVYVAEVSNVVLGGRTSQPEDELYCDYLGTAQLRQDTARAIAHTLTFNANSLELYRENTLHDSLSMQLLAVDSLKILGLAYQWPFRPTTNDLPSEIYLDDPLFVARVLISSVHVFERMDLLVQALHFYHAHRDQAKPYRDYNRPPVIWKNIPRLFVEGSVKTISACIVPTDRGPEPTPALVYKTDGFVVAFTGDYTPDLMTKLPIKNAQVDDYLPLRWKITAHITLEPGVIISEPRRPDTFNMSPSTLHMTSSGDPLFSYSVADIHLDSDLLAVMIGRDETLLNVADAAIGLVCGVDVISLELWHPVAITSLSDVLGAINELRAAGSRHRRVNGSSQRQNTLSVSTHIGIGKLLLMATALDIDPNEDSGLTRGVAATSGITMEFCMLGENTTRIPRQNWYIRASARRQLSLPDDLRVNAMALLHSDGSDSSITLSRIALHEITLRTAMATRYTADVAYDCIDDSAHLKAQEFFWMSTGQVDINFRFVQNGNQLMQVHVLAKFPSFRANVQVTQVYCTLLAASVVRSLTSRLKEKTSTREPQTMLPTFKVSMGKCQVVVKLPLQMEICWCISNLAVETRGRSSVSINWRLMQVFVPSPFPPIQWEEVLALRSFTLAYRLESQSPHIDVKGEAARIYVPFGYVIADLLLDCSIMLKAIRHLVRVIEEGQFRPLDEPGEEDAIYIPNVTAVIGRILLEVADDPLESRLALILKAGLDAAATRLEREDAFNAKVATIRAAEERATGALATMTDSRFTPRHTVSIEDALLRLYQVHAISWTSTLNEHRNLQRSKEDKIRAQYRTDSNFSLYDSPAPSNIKPPHRNPPLLRIVFNSFSANATPPTMTAMELADYLNDVGKGLNRDTKFNLLVPLSVKICMGSTTVSLRDYPIPLLHIPRSRTSDESSWVIDTNFIVGEELGTGKNVVFKPCIIVPNGYDSATSRGFSLLVPKTTMPVKTYATPTVIVNTEGITQMCWGISYNPTLQDVMHVLDSLTSPPPDPSPNIGFWDKVKLIPSS